MKNLFCTFYIICLSIISVYGQDLSCATADISFGPITCETENNVDFLAVTLMVSNLNNSSCSAFFSISNLPDDVSVDGSPIGSNGITFDMNGSYDLAIPSDDCADVIIDTNAQQTDENNGDSCSSCENSSVLLAVTRGIPTLGQWGILILSILFAIVGLTVINKRFLIQDRLLNK